MNDRDRWLFDDEQYAIPLTKWQKTIDVMAKIFQAPAGFIVQHTNQGYQVVIASQQDSNPYPAAGGVIPLNCNIFCRKIVQTGQKLYVKNAKADPYWDDNPEVAQDGFMSYYGLPVNWPDNTPFGTICVMDFKETDYQQDYLDLMEELRNLIEYDLQLSEQYHTTVQLAANLEKANYELMEATKLADIANQAKSAFIANMSHELRTPLNAILGFTQIMTRSQTLPPEHQEKVSIINRSGEHLLTLINNVLDLSKIEAGRITLNEKNFDLHCLLDDLHDMFQLKANDKGLQLLLELAENLPRYIRTDEVKLRQILINLINNALKFTEQGGISLRAIHQSPVTSDRPTTIHFEVEDTGAGIAPEELDRLFEAFTQTTSGKQAQEGTGLGLSISRKFAQLMGGEIRATSRVGEGTIFSFEIQCQPVEATEVEALKPQHQIIALQPDQPCYRLLIVDDKPVNRQILIQLLGPLGFELKEAGNGKEALEIWEQWEPHLIWMDMKMPVMDGFEATKTIKATTKGQATVVLALTASVLEEEKAVVLSAGCDDFLRKPFRDEQIFKALEKHLEVRYIYEDSVPSSKNSAPEKDVLTAENVQALSSEIQLQLHQAVISASEAAITAVVTAIAEKNPALSEAIANCFHNFEYDKISILLPEREDFPSF
ncbi:ATP-binding protein [Roseofilum casamattae]|uniref:histidine kinase n=1 Tax=Roseofilum casamattae BLCC-M143 TaxID=3022442 RepID=A0ABT7BUV2_9CYAN|nr:ATP-binding protein [Roseofilum casamattae]MDJ1182968.1 ATP-binding protein [Roseofilum casamattae BLCC-M143]